MAQRTVRCLVIQMPAMSELFPGHPSATPREVPPLDDPYMAALLRRLHELDALGSPIALELPPPPLDSPATPLTARPVADGDEQSPSDD